MLHNRLSPQRTPSTCHSRAPHSAHSFSRASRDKSGHCEKRVEEDGVKKKSRGRRGRLLLYLSATLLAYQACAGWCVVLHHPSGVLHLKLYHGDDQPPGFFGVILGETHMSRSPEADVHLGLARLLKQERSLKKTSDKGLRVTTPYRVGPDQVEAYQRGPEGRNHGETR
jgi:hypothetical protein